MMVRQEIWGTSFELKVCSPNKDLYFQPIARWQIGPMDSDVPVQLGIGEVEAFFSQGPDLAEIQLRFYTRNYAGNVSLENRAVKGSPDEGCGFVTNPDGGRKYLVVWKRVSFEDFLTE